MTLLSAGITDDVVVLEDHESAATAADLYNDGTVDATVVSDATLEGGQLLDLADTFVPVGYDATDICSRGHTYRARTYDKAGGATHRLYVGSQDSTSVDNETYTLIVDIGSDEIRLLEETGGSNNLLSQASVSLSDQTEYRPEIEYGPQGESGNIVGRLRDSSDTLLQSVSGTSDLHTGGTFGFNSGGGAGLLADYITERSI